MTDKEKRVAVIAGGIRDLATSIARRLTREGFDLAIIDRDRKSMLHVATQIGRETGRDILTITADITVEGQLSAALSRVAQQFGRTDLVITYAGLVTNRESFPLCVRYTTPSMEEEGSGLVIQVDPESGRIVQYHNAGDPAAAYTAEPGDQILKDNDACDEIMRLINVY